MTLTALFLLIQNPLGSGDERVIMSAPITFDLDSIHESFSLSLEK